MVEAFERPFLLPVSKMLVPLELRNQRNPLRAKWEKWNHTEGSYDLGTDASQRITIRNALLNRRNAWRRHKPQPDQLGSDPRRHDPGQIARIGKEQKYLLNRNRHPLLVPDMMCHQIPLNLKGRPCQVFHRICTDARTATCDRNKVVAGEPSV